VVHTYPFGSTTLQDKALLHKDVRGHLQFAISSWSAYLHDPLRPFVSANMPRDLNDIQDAGAQEQRHKMSAEDNVATEQQAPMMATETTESPAEHNENAHGALALAARKSSPIYSRLDLESCVKLEEATFPPAERCSREKVSLGLSCMRCVFVWYCSAASDVFRCFTTPHHIEASGT